VRKRRGRRSSSSSSSSSSLHLPGSFIRSFSSVPGIHDDDKHFLYQMLVGCLFVCRPPVGHLEMVYRGTSNVPVTSKSDLRVTQASPCARFTRIVLMLLSSDTDRSTTSAILTTCMLRKWAVVTF
jgi:hypothetical protein